MTAPSSEPKKRGLPTGIYRSGKGYKYVVDLPSDPATGKRRQESRAGFRTVKEATNARAERITDVERGRNTASGNPTLRDFLLKDWLPTKRGVRPHSRHTYAQDVNRIIQFLGGVRVRDLDPRKVAHWHGQMLARPYKPATIAHTHLVLSMALADAVHWGMAPRNVASLVTPPQPAPFDVRANAWTAKEMQRFLEVADRDAWAPLWRLALLTGLRVGELCALRWTAVDLRRRSLAVLETVTRDELGRDTLGPPKTAASQRRVTLTEGICLQLRDWRRQQAREREDAGAIWQDQGFVFARRDGGFVHPKSVRLRLRTLIAVANVSKITLHGLRHTSATIGMQLGEHPRAAQLRLGHANVAITLGIYSHVQPMMSTGDAQRLDEVMHMQPAPDEIDEHEA